MRNIRQQKLLSLLSIDLEVKISTLLEQLDISEATLRRDLSELAENGKIVRTHGGALLRPEAINEASFLDKELSAPEQKREIASYAANIIPTGASVYIDSGTTCLEVARILLRRGDCPIFTNSLPILIDACKYNARVTGIGGTLREVSRALIGSAALSWLENLNVDYSLIGASALNVSRGAYTTETLEASVKQHAIQSSNQSILVCDHSKWISSAPVRFARWSDFDRLITDKAPESTTQKHLQQQLQVNVVGVK
ncbi:DeoR/GlpR family DNA-binding transcription regulator [Coraliomargarita algicola]|uniref:DeoR/GlpR family DNA-binding transcription regulator n=2 Tax=Coraliomargaritaceae TaxID=3056371 RepID=A0ABU1AZ03_9BACT|nr:MULTISPECIES: DeoR/GlpR family DNA-binding transcription regulator [unclassified Coraliomargarita]MDQ8208355.1 DeoR/GlpR family DNA-binding transcription regulator [Coraliomargarita sp. SDUM461003]WPJ95881.1 DeoR/GlpR family DNA-binding transcription regulator [Coraliomargarita sp. J2-16]